VELSKKERRNIMKKPRILSIISRESNTGKTTFIEEIIPELSKRGYRIMT
jgi:molybdopterin-guanine dinucleotide biosynthesis protein